MVARGGDEVTEAYQEFFPRMRLFAYPKLRLLAVPDLLPLPFALIVSRK